MRVHRLRMVRSSCLRTELELLVLLGMQENLLYRNNGTPYASHRHCNLCHHYICKTDPKNTESSGSHEKSNSLSIQQVAPVLAWALKVLVDSVAKALEVKVEEEPMAEARLPIYRNTPGRTFYPCMQWMPRSRHL